LGEIELTLQDDRLMLDAGEFALELRAVDGQPERYLTYDQPLLGLPVHLDEAETGEAQVILGAGVVEYAFTPLE
jgi:hypothetical protein